MTENHYSHDAPFAGLVEAATAAAGEDHIRSEPLPDFPHHNDEFNGHEAAVNDEFLGPRSHKRRRIDDNPSQGQYVPLSQVHDEQVPFSLYDDPPEPPTDVATVLFKEPSASSKRYTRPPMSTLYSSLQLTPEDFLHLQSAAKDYMLNPDHSERRDCVGQKGAVHNHDMVKLRMWNCTKDFLTAKGNGERYWGPLSEQPSTAESDKTLLWPRDSHDIIKACIPLLRRMVTNERQRKYAASARKTEQPVTPAIVGSKAVHGLEGLDFQKENPLIDSGQVYDKAPVINGESSAHSTGGVHDIQFEEGTSSIGQLSHPETQTQQQGSKLNLSIHISILSGEKQAMPRFTLQADVVTTIQALRSHAARQCRNASLSLEVESAASPVKLWLPDGLVEVKSDGEWMVALLAVKKVEWMDGEAKVLIQTQPQSRV